MLERCFILIGLLIKAILYRYLKFFYRHKWVRANGAKSWIEDVAQLLTALTRRLQSNKKKMKSSSCLTRRIACRLTSSDVIARTTAYWFDFLSDNFYSPSRDLNPPKGNCSRVSSRHCLACRQSAHQYAAHDVSGLSCAVCAPCCSI